MFKKEGVVMKKAGLAAALVCMCLIAVACSGADGQGTVVIRTLEPPAAATTAPASTITPVTVSEPPETSAPLPAPSPTPTTAPTPTPAPTPVNPRMYSSYADMVSFDASNGWARFDYWDMLKGDAAVDWLVEHEGYTQAQAQDIVDDYADSEYIKKNVNPQLRTIDLSAVPVGMLPYPHGYEYAPEPEPVVTSFSDLCSLYSTDPDILLSMNYYYVTVGADGTVTRVDQCYQP